MLPLPHTADLGHHGFHRSVSDPSRFGGLRRQSVHSVVGSGCHCSNPERRPEQMGGARSVASDAISSLDPLRMG